jgi:putative hydrolase of the HAD superfamily
VKLLDNYRLFLLDLDDTLYLESDYVVSGLTAVSHCFAQYGIDPDEANQWLGRRFLEQGRHRILNDCLAHFDIAESQSLMENLISVYRHHQPLITLLPGVKDVLDYLLLKGRIVIVTDGLPVMQSNKCRALGLDRWTEDWFLCWAHNDPKPGVRALSEHVKGYSGPTLMVGDNPAHDLFMADCLKIEAIRVRQGRFKQQGSEPWRPLLEIDNIPALLMLQSITFPPQNIT